jgi:hypothetical protein
MNCFPFAYVCGGDSRYFSLWPSEKSAASEALFFLYARSDGLDDRQDHLEGLTAIFDVMPARNSIKISIDRPNITTHLDRPTGAQIKTAFRAEDCRRPGESTTRV